MNPTATLAPAPLDWSPALFLGDARMAEALAEWFPLHATSKDAGLAQHLKNVGFDSGTETELGNQASGLQIKR